MSGQTGGCQPGTEDVEKMVASLTRGVRDVIAEVELNDTRATIKMIDNLDALDEASTIMDDDEGVPYPIPGHWEEAKQAHQSLSLLDHLTNPAFHPHQLRRSQEEDADLADLYALKLAGSPEPASRDKRQATARGITFYKEYHNLYASIECILMRKQPYHVNAAGCLKSFSQIVLPRTLINMVLELHHSGGIEAHIGPQKLYQKIIRSFYWGNKRQMMDDIETFQMKPFP